MVTAMNKGVTLKDIAERAGVSIATVSMVLNGKADKRVSEETALLIRDIAAQAQYRPNMNAQLLKGKRSLSIGLIIPDIANYFYSEMAKGIMEKASAAGYYVVMFNADNDLKKEAFAVETMISLKVAGAIVCGVDQSGEEEECILASLTQKGITTVKVDRCTSDSAWPCVRINNYQAAYDGTRFLLEYGHRNIALVTIKASLNMMKEREQGFCQAMRGHGVPVTEEDIFRVDLSHFAEAAHGVADAVLSCGKRYSAVFVIPGDWLAIECMKYWKERGCHIPDDLSVMGFDNMYAGEMVDPSLTTIDQPGYEMGTRAFTLLEDLLNYKKGVKQNIVLEHHIVGRQSVKQIQ